MKRRYVSAFALLGFLAAILFGLLEKAELGDILLRSLLWGGSFGALGFALGCAAHALLDETNIGKEFSKQGLATRESRERTDVVDFMAQELMAREVEKSPILLQRLQPSAENNDEPGPVEHEDQGEN